MEAWVYDLNGETMKDKINIQIDKETHEWLEGLKRIPQEPFLNVLKRIKNKEITI